MIHTGGGRGMLYSDLVTVYESFVTPCAGAGMNAFLIGGIDFDC